MNEDFLEKFHGHRYVQKYYLRFQIDVVSTMCCCENVPVSDEWAPAIVNPRAIRGEVPNGGHPRPWGFEIRTLLHLGSMASTYLFAAFENALRLNLFYTNNTLPNFNRGQFHHHAYMLLLHMEIPKA